MGRLIRKRDGARKEVKEAVLCLLVGVRHHSGIA